MATMSLRLTELIEKHEQQSGQRLALEDLALATGIPLPTLQELYEGRGDQVSLQWLAALCDYFDCSPGQLLRYDSATQRQVGEDQPAAVDAREIVERWERDYGQDERPVS